MDGLSKSSLIKIINCSVKNLNVDVSDFDIPNLQELSCVEHAIGCQFMWVCDIIVKIPAKSVDCKDFILCSIRVMANDTFRVRLQIIEEQ